MARDGEDGRLAPPARDAIRKLGAKFDPDVLAATRALFERDWDLSLPPGGEIKPDISYGDDPRQTFDLYASGKDAPLLVYVPGGGFVGGDKAGYLHLGLAFARLGCDTAIVNYRLAPDHPWPTGARDVAAALDHLSGFGKPIYVIAQSAGAAHTSGALFDPRFQPKALASIRSAILMSGFYEMDETLARAPNLRAYFGEVAADYADRSPIHFVSTLKTPVALTVAEFDPLFLARQTLGLASALTERDGKCPWLIWNEGHNHVSPALSIGAGPGDMARRLLDVLQRL